MNLLKLCKIINTIANTVIASDITTIINIIANAYENALRDKTAITFRHILVGIDLMLAADCRIKIEGSVFENSNK